ENSSAGRRPRTAPAGSSPRPRRRAPAPHAAPRARADGRAASRAERLFQGHGVASNEPWLVQAIEPNLVGATAIAAHWYELPASPLGVPAEVLGREFQKRGSAGS